MKQVWAPKSCFDRTTRGYHAGVRKELAVRDRKRGGTRLRLKKRSAIDGPRGRESTPAGRLLDTATQCIKAGELARAEMILQQILRRDPLHREACATLGDLLLRTERSTEAVEPLRIAAESNLQCARVHRALGEAYLQSGTPDAARDCFARACELAPSDARAHDGLGLAELDLGCFEQAEASFRTALRLDPGVPGVCLNLSRCRRFSTADGELIAAVEGALDLGLAQEATADVHFALGKIYDDLGRVEQAFEHYERANRCTHLRMRYDQDAHERVIDRLIESFPGERFLERSGAPSELPVFVVGMPRSGTSLVEQMLAAHPQVHGGGERLDIDDLSRGIKREIGARNGYPRCVAELDPAGTRRLAESYLKGVQSRSGPAARATDKLPTNFLHLGLIGLLLPDARVIHCRRNPMDTSFSVYTQQFERGHPWAYDFDDIAAFYAAYERLMAHWYAVLPRPPFELSYEELVAAPEVVCRRMLAYVGLPWDPDCLEFHRISRAVSTASNWQVRQPLYRGSSGRWKRYARFLEPLNDALRQRAVLPIGPARSEPAGDPRD